jgi:hypothetical protein
MEKHVKLLERKIQFRKVKNKRMRTQNTINMSNWKEFKFIDEKLWTKIKYGERLIEADRIKGDMPY